MLLRQVMTCDIDSVAIEQVLGLAHDIMVITPQIALRIGYPVYRRMSPL
jgi:hypothetical protein